MFVTRSIIAGCVSSTCLARAITRQPLLDVDAVASRLAAEEQLLEYIAGVHVDDVSQLFVAQCDEALVEPAVSLGHALVDALQRLGFRISASPR